MAIVESRSRLGDDRSCEATTTPQAHEGAALSTWYRVMCDGKRDQKHPLTPVCDIEHDKTKATADLYERLVKGEVSMRDSFGNPAPYAAIPPRLSSGEIAVIPQRFMRYPEGTVDVPPKHVQIQARLEALAKGRQPPTFPSEFITTAYIEVGDEPHTDGHKFGFKCAIAACRFIVPPVSAGTLALVLDRIGEDLEPVEADLRERDDSRQWVTRRTVLRLLPLRRLRQEIGNNPRG